MKKLLTLALAAAMMAGAAQFALAAEDDGASSIMAQINSFKATNQEKTGGEAAECRSELQKRLTIIGYETVVSRGDHPAVKPG